MEIKDYGTRPCWTKVGDGAEKNVLEFDIFKAEKVQAGFTAEIVGCSTQWRRIWINVQEVRWRVIGCRVFDVVNNNETKQRNDQCTISHLVWTAFPTVPPLGFRGG